jgi:hypothetical protein
LSDDVRGKARANEKRCADERNPTMLHDGHDLTASYGRKTRRFATEIRRNPPSASAKATAGHVALAKGFDAAA